jgi:ABC-2 type transport system ATP-binding protein
MKVAVEAAGLGRRYGRHTWALRDCSLAIPAGRVVALVGPNGAGKTTLLHLAMGLQSPTTGTVEVFGWSPATHPLVVLSRVGFVAQDRPLYGRFTVAEMLEFGRRLNPRFDASMARERVGRLGLPLERPVGKLSGGQRAQVALTITLAKRPELLILDEPLSGLDPLARREFLQGLMEAVAAEGLSVILSSHILSELERVCDHLVILNGGQVQVAGDIDAILAAHHVLVGPPGDEAALAADPSVISSVRSDRQTTLLVRSVGRAAGPGWESHDVSLEDVVLAYLGRPSAGSLPVPQIVALTEAAR